jgi:hypothetical protein
MIILELGQLLPRSVADRPLSRLMAGGGITGSAAIERLDVSNAPHHGAGNMVWAQKGVEPPREIRRP